MFQPATLLNITDEIALLIAPYIYLREDLPAGLDKRFKFTNDNKGVPTSTKEKLNTLADGILNNTLSIKKDEWIVAVDALVLFSNHLDQQRNKDENPAPTLAVKEALVYRWNHAAFKLASKFLNHFDVTKLAEYDNRELSSYAQLLFYYAKARRYNNEAAEDRLAMVETAQFIALYLEQLTLDSSIDPHGYDDRLTTIELPIIYCLCDLHRYDEAFAVVQNQIDRLDKHTNTFHARLAYARFIDIATLEAKHHDSQDINPRAFQYGQTALTLREIDGLYGSIELALQKAYLQAGEIDESLKYAEIIATAPKGTIKESDIKVSQELITAAQNQLENTQRLTA